MGIIFSCCQNNDVKAVQILKPCLKYNEKPKKIMKDVVLEFKNEENKIKIVEIPKVKYVINRNNIFYKSRFR